MGILMKEILMKGLLPTAEIAGACAGWTDAARDTARQVASAWQHKFCPRNARVVMAVATTDFANVDRVASKMATQATVKRTGSATLKLGALLSVGLAKCLNTAFPSHAPETNKRLPRTPTAALCVPAASSAAPTPTAMKTATALLTNGVSPLDFGISANLEAEGPHNDARHEATGITTTILAPRTKCV